MSERFQNALGEAIRARRKEKGLTQEQLASAADMHVNYVSALERGRYNPTVLKLRDLASALDTTATVLIEAAEHMLSGDR